MMPTITSSVLNTAAMFRVVTSDFSIATLMYEKSDSFGYVFLIFFRKKMMRGASGKSAEIFK
jgi:hypothetical protein